MILPTPSITRISFLMLCAAALISLYGNAQLFPDQDPSIDYYCGINWKEANTYCNLPCPSGNDTDCPPVQSTGRVRYCLASAGCAARLEQLYWTGIISLEFDREEHAANGNGGVIMTGSDMNAFQSSLMRFLGEGVKQLDNIEITCVEVQEQEYDRPCVGAVVPDRRLYELVDSDNELKILLAENIGTDDTSIQQYNRRLSRDESITALDMKVQVCAQYIPALDGSNKVSESDLQNDIFHIITNRENGAVNAIKSSSNFFIPLTGITAISSDMTVDPPTSSPSTSPTRSQFQTIQTFIDMNPTGSYGIFFSVKTLANVSTILLTGMSFLTPYDGLMEYEIRTRIGDYLGYEDRLYEWDLIAKANTTGNGVANLTRVLDEKPEDYNDSGYVAFAPIHILGNKGMRSFYITATKTLKMPDGFPIPISFSNPMVPENEGMAKYGVVVSNEELEILEGDGVLGKYTTGHVLHFMIKNTHPIIICICVCLRQITLHQKMMRQCYFTVSHADL
jgi:hypothetical protein